MADRSIKVIVGANVAGLVNGMRTAKGAVEDFSKAGDDYFKRNRDGLEQLAATSTRAGAALLGMAVFAGKAAMDWETAWAGVTKTVDGSAAQMGQLEDELRELARTLPSSHKEIAAVAEAAGQLGVAREDVSDFTRTMIDLGETTNLTADEAATSIAQMMNVMQTAPEDVDNLASALVALGNDGASTERDIVQMAQALAGAGATVGLTESEVLALANALASVGINAEAGGSSVSKILIDMSKAAKTGSPDLETWAQTARMSTEAFGDLVQQDPARAFNAFTDGLGRIAAEGGDVFTLLEGLGQTDVRVTRALLGMANAGDLLSDSLELGASSWRTNTALAEEAAKRYDTTAAQAQVAWNNIKDNAIDAGQGMLPVISALSDVVVTLSGAFGALPGPVKSSLGLIAGGAGGLLLAAAAFTKLYGTVQDTREAYRSLSGTSPRIASGLRTAATAAGVAGAAFVAMNAAFELLDRDSAATVEDMTAAILDLADGASTLNGELSNSRGLLSMATGASELEASIKEAWRGTDGATAAMSKLFSLGGALGALNPYGDALEDVQAYDEALTSLVNSGATEQAAEGHDEFARAAKAAGLETKDIERLLPGYTAALQNVDNEARIAAEGTQALEEAQAQATAAQEEATKRATDQANAFLGLGSAVGDAKVSLSGWLEQLEEQSAALRDFTDNAIEAASRGLHDGLIAELQAAGPEGALRMKELADGSEKEIARANRAWQGGQRAVADYADVFDSVPSSVITQFKTAGSRGAVRTAVEVAEAADLNAREVRTILSALDYASGDIDKVLKEMARADAATATPTVNLRDNATAKLNGIGSQLSNLTNRVVDTYVNVIERKKKANADGGLSVGGHWKAYADGGIDEFGRQVQRVPQLRSGAQGAVVWGEAETGWEAYVSGKPSQKPRNREILAEAAARLGGSVQWFADGAFTEAVSARELTGLRIRVRDLNRALNATEKTKKGRRKVLRGLDRVEALQELREAKAELAEQNRIRREIGKGKTYATAGAYNRAKQRALDNAEAAREATESRQATAASFTSGLGADAFKSPVSLERALADMLRDSAEHTQLLADLKKAGASPWLLEQLIKAGPSRATNRTARALLADRAYLGRINALSSGIQTVGNQYAALTAQSGFTAGFTGAAAFDYNALARAMSQVQLNASLQVSGRQAGVLVQAGQNHVGSNQ